MYINLRYSYVRQLRSNELVRSRGHYRQYNNSIILRKRIINKPTLELPLVTSTISNDYFYNPFLFHNHYGHNLIFLREISLSACRTDKEPLKPSSKVEVTVNTLKDEQKNQEISTQKVEEKKPLKQRIVDELMHYYHGFRLLFIDIKISCGLVWRILKGKTLTRREHNLLVRTVGDLFRLVPFSVFIVVPFLEFTLPFFIKFFPGMLPTTFQTAKEREDKLKQNLKMKLEMAKFLQETLDDMAVQHKDRHSSSAREFVQWFHKVRTSGEQVSNEDIMKYSKLFQDEITLDSLSRGQLVALCRVLEVQTLGTNNLLKFQLRMKLRNLAADDKLIQKEGVDSLTVTELQNACRARGMRAYGLSEEMLRKQLSQWLDLSLNQKVPPSLLLLSRALMLPDTIPTSDKLKATISVLPDAILTQTSAAIAENEGKIDNKMKLEVIKEEARKVKEERLEQREERKRKEQEKKEILEDTAQVISDDINPLVCVYNTSENKKDKQISSKDINVLEEALDSVAKNKLILEKETIEDLKEEMTEYQEDLEELKEVASCGDKKVEIKESVAAKRLFNRVDKMIQKMDKVVTELENKEQQLKKSLAGGESKVTQEDIVRVDELIDAVKKMQKVKNESVIQQIENILGKIDDDHDGNVKVDDVLKVIEVIGKENVQLSTKQVDDIIELIDKEEILEVEDKIEKALQKGAEQKSTMKLVNEKANPPNIDVIDKQTSNKTGDDSKLSDKTKSDAHKAKIQTPPTPPPPTIGIQPKEKGNDKMI